MRSLMPFGLPLLLALVMGGVARADDAWPASFSAPALATYLDANGEAVLVATTGDSSRPAARALVTGLRQTGRTRLVTDDASLGDLSGASDADIVKKCRAYPVDSVAVVRVFPSGSNAPPTAVVTFYSNKSGELLGALTVAEGTPVPARTNTSAVPSAAMNSVSEVVTNHQEGTPERPGQRLLEQKGIWSYDTFIFNGAGVVGDYAVFTKGKFGPRLSMSDLFSYLGREDYSQHYRSLMAARISLIVVGGVAALTGGILAAIGGLEADTPPDLVGTAPDRCARVDPSTGLCAEAANASSATTMMWAGVGLAVIGTAGAIVGLVLNPMPISREQLYQMINDFNGKLTDGPADSSTSRADDAAPALAWTVTPFTVRGAQGGAFVLRF